MDKVKEKATPIRGLTKRGQAVAKQKKDVCKKWYEKYLSQKYYDTIALSKRFEKEIVENTDENTSLYAPVFEVSTLKKDASIKRVLTLRITNAR